MHKSASTYQNGKLHARLICWATAIYFVTTSVLINVFALPCASNTSNRSQQPTDCPNAEAINNCTKYFLKCRIENNNNDRNKRKTTNIFDVRKKCMYLKKQRSLASTSAQMYVYYYYLLLLLLLFFCIRLFMAVRTNCSAILLYYYHYYYDYCCCCLLNLSCRLANDMCVFDLYACILNTHTYTYNYHERLFRRFFLLFFKPQRKYIQFTRSSSSCLLACNNPQHIETCSEYECNWNSFQSYRFDLTDPSPEDLSIYQFFYLF